jgi:hypothetical protein
MKRYLIRFALLVMVIEIALSVALTLLGVKYIDYS